MTVLQSKEFFRQRMRNRLYEDVIKATEMAANEGVRRKDIAEVLDIPPSQVSRWLSGPSNWAIDSVSDILWSIGAELDFKVRFFNDRVKLNYAHPLSEYISMNNSVGSRSQLIESASKSNMAAQYSFVDARSSRLLGQ